jgi:Kdo2-lipid IVA lauroyltransferase/acyltransferase
VILWLTRAFTRLPKSTIHWVADVLGRVAYWLYRKERHLALRNVRTFYPNASASIQRDIVIRSFQHMVHSAFDLMRFAAVESGRWPTITIRHLERLDAALNKGRGVVLITGHYGNVEILMFALKEISSYPAFLWHKPTSRIGWVVAQFRRYRETIVTPNTGFQPLESSVRGVMKAGHLLKRGNVVIMAADRTWGSGFITVTFLNQPFRMSRVPASVSLRTHASLLPVIAVRHRDGQYDIIVEEPIECLATVSHGDAERTMMVTFAQILARHVESTPEQWCWTQLIEQRDSI